MSFPTTNTGADALRRLLKTNKVRHAGAILRGGASGPPERVGIAVSLDNGTHLRVTDKTFKDVIGPIVETPTEHELKDEAPIFVYGRPGCGKTRNAKWIAETFGRDFDDVVDGWDRGDPIEGGNVYLCIEPPIQAEAPRAIIVPFERLGQAPNLDTPPQHPFTCGTDHVRAQAILTLVEGLISMANPCDANMIEQLDTLVSEAGVTFASGIIKRGCAADDVPF